MGYVLRVAGLLLLLSTGSPAQNPGYLSGSVRDDSTGAPVPRASILVEGSYRGAAADVAGRFVLELPAGDHSVRIQAVGYESETQTVQINPGDTTHLSVALDPVRVELGTITVEEDFRERPTAYRLTPRSMSSAPALGEPDVVRTAARLPGLMQTDDRRAQLNIWGGAADQTRYMIDGVTVYNPTHALGIFSAFNPKALEEVDLHAGTFPVRYGNRLSGVVNVKTRSTADTSLFHGHISLVSASAGTARQFGDTFVMAAGRRTYLDPVLAAMDTEIRYNFHDLNLKVRRDLGRGISIAAIGFTSRDLRREPSATSDALRERLSWGNKLGALRLSEHTGSTHHRLTLSAVEYAANVSHMKGGFVRNSLLDRTARYDGRWASPGTLLRLGGAFKHYRLKHQWNGESLDLGDYFYRGLPPQFDRQRSDPLTSLYTSAAHSLADGLDMSVGLRYSSLGSPADGILAPRFSVSYAPGDRTSVSLSAGKYAQHIGTGRENRSEDITVGAPYLLLDRPQEAWTYALSTRLHPSTNYRVRASAYYRNISRMARLRPSAEESYPNVRYRRSRVYGANALLEKRRGWLTFQIGYAFTYPTVRMNDGWRVADWNVPHALQGMIGFELGSWRLSVAGQYRSGLPYTPAVGWFRGIGSGWSSPFLGRDSGSEARRGALEYYFLPGVKNSERLPAYGRMDIAVRRSFDGGKFAWDLYLQAINLLNARNVLGISPRLFYQQYTVNLHPSAYDPYAAAPTSLPVIPSVGVELTLR